MITMESRTEGIKFEHHKEESLISFLEEPKEEQNLTFSDFLFNQNSALLQGEHAIYMSWQKNLLNIKTLNKSWFGLKLADPK